MTEVNGETVRPPAGQPAVARLQDLDGEDRSRFGGKAAGLARLVIAGLPVPPGVAIAADALHAAAASHLETPLQALTSDALRLVEAQVDGNCLLAVRSSALAEDGLTRAAAGVYATVLGVSGEAEVADAVSTVLQSQQYHHVDLYWGDTEGVSNVGVVVQRMIRPFVAGVLFTRDPIAGDRDYVLEACVGLGISVVEGDGVLERLVVDPLSATVLRRDSAPSGLCRQWSDEHRAIVTSRVADRTPEPLLSDREVVFLVEFGRFIEAEFGVPVDVEWAIDGDGLWILQSRPITTLGLQ